MCVFGEDGILPGITQCMNGWFGAQRIMLCCAGLHPSQLCMSDLPSLCISSLFIAAVGVE